MSYIVKFVVVEPCVYILTPIIEFIIDLVFDGYETIRRVKLI